MDHIKIDVANASDRDALVGILARNGYTVRIGREKRGNKNVYIYFVEYWKGG